MDTDTRIHLLSRIVDKLIRMVILHPVKLTLDWRCSDFESELDEIQDEYDDEYEDQMKTLLEEIRKEGLNTVVLPKQTLFMTTPRTGNSDVRGGGCGDLGFKQEDFRWVIQNPSGVTLRQLTEAVYRMKGSKYDWWYELYGGLSLKEETETSYSLSVTFDYGS